MAPVPNSGITASRLYAETTVNFVSSMTVADMQALIDAQPKDCNGYALIFQFADGTYTLDAPLFFYGFSGGLLNINGNLTEGNTLHTNQAVVLDGSSWAGAAHSGLLWIASCPATVTVSDIKVIFPDVTDCAGVLFNSCNGPSLQSNFLLGSGVVNDSCGVRWWRCVGNSYNTTVSNCKHGFRASNSQVYLSVNQSVATLPTYAMWANEGGNFGVNRTGSVPIGASKESVISTGGTIDCQMLTDSTTINLDSSMSAADIQALIDDQPKNLNGYSLTFQFADGTYTLNNWIYFAYFFGGNVYVYGNTSEGTSAYTTQGVHLNFTTWASGGSRGCIQFDRCACYCLVRNIKFTIRDVAETYGIHGNVSLSVMPQANYFLGAGKTTMNSGVKWNGTSGAAYSNYVSNLHRGIHVDRSTVLSSANQSTGTGPNYGLVCVEGGQIGKSGTQPTGTLAAETTGTGGTIA